MKTKYVDPFHGNGEVNLPNPEGISANWFWIKAQTGNTHPGAATPYGCVTACSFSGGYPTGYGINGANTCATPAKIHDKLVTDGITHFQVSGTGAINNYYNFFKMIPAPEGVYTGFHSLTDEKASVGYYSMTWDNNIKTESTVSHWCSYHKVHFLPENKKMLIFDCSSSVSHDKNHITVIEKVYCNIENNNVSYTIKNHGIDVTAYFEFENVKTIKEYDDSNTFGFIVEFEDNQLIVEPKIAFSLKSTESAKKHFEEIKNLTFEETLNNAIKKWEEHIDTITIKSNNEDDLIKFYSCLYRTGIKPCDAYGDNFLFDDEEFFFDYATLWDQYKTQLPFIMTFYPQTGIRMTNAYIKLSDRLKKMINTFIISDDTNKETSQATGLYAITSADAFYRGLDLDYEYITHVVYNSLKHGLSKNFFEGKYTEMPAHTLDLSQDAFACAVLLKHIGENEKYKEMMQHASRFINAFDKNTGMLPIGARYYEGDYRNYSFRLLHNMQARIELIGKDNFITQLDEFFGINAEPVKPFKIIEDKETYNKGASLHRFEGFNNETDMETPFAYLYCNRHDRLCEITTAGYKYMLASNSGGFPGNEDSGGLSSLFTWIAMGLFPVAGQPIMLLGKPEFEKIELKENEVFCQKTINAFDLSNKNIYVNKIIVDGSVLNRAWLTIKEFKHAKSIDFYMTDKPSNFDEVPPPSFDENNIDKFI